MIQQPAIVASPDRSDAGLISYSQTLQGNLKELFQVAHEHRRITSVPKVNDGAIGDIYIFDDGTNIRLYVKTSRGWAVSTAFTLI